MRGARDARDARFGVDDVVRGVVARVDARARVPGVGDPRRRVHRGGSRGRRAPPPRRAAGYPGRRAPRRACPSVGVRVARLRGPHLVRRLRAVGVRRRRIRRGGAPTRRARRPRRVRARRERRRRDAPRLRPRTHPFPRRPPSGARTPRRRPRASTPTRLPARGDPRGGDPPRARRRAPRRRRRRLRHGVRPHHPHTPPNDIRPRPPASPPPSRRPLALHRRVRDASRASSSPRRPPPPKNPRDAELEPGFEPSRVRSRSRSFSPRGSSWRCTPETRSREATR